jgi:hypothetical protein
MANLILEMRDNGRNTRAKKQRLELLAEHFLRVTDNGDPDSISSAATTDTERQMRLN